MFLVASNFPQAKSPENSFAVVALAVIPVMCAGERGKAADEKDLRFRLTVRLGKLCLGEKGYSNS